MDFIINTTGSWNYDDPANGTHTKITRLASGSIPAGATVLVSYDFVVDFQVAAVSTVLLIVKIDFRNEYISLSDPKVFEIYEPRVNATLTYLHPGRHFKVFVSFLTDFVFTGMDEIRGMNRDSRSQKRNMENYQVSNMENSL